MAASDERLIIMRKGELLALDVMTGKPVWSIRPGVLTAPPLVSGEWLLLASGESIAATASPTAARCGAATTPARSEQRPAISGDRAYIPAADGRILALDLKSGKADLGVSDWRQANRASRPRGTGVCRALKPSCSAASSLTPGARTGAPILPAQPAGGLSPMPGTSTSSGSTTFFARTIGRMVPSGGPKICAIAHRQARCSWAPALRRPGNVPRVPVFEDLTGKKDDPDNAGRTRLLDGAATDRGEPGNPARIAAVTGDLQNRWHLTLIGPAAPAVPAIAVDPLTALPGQAIPIGLPPVLPRTAAASPVTPSSIRDGDGAENDRRR